MSLDFSHVVLREATCDDVDSLAMVHVQAWQETYGGLLPQELIDFLDLKHRKMMWSKIFQEQNSDTATFLCVSDNEEILGFASGVRNSNNPDNAELTCLYVLKKFQRRNVGNLLLKKVAAEMFKRECVTLEVNVLANNPYLTFYKKLGGSPCGSHQTDFMGHNILESRFTFDLLNFPYKL